MLSVYVVHHVEATVAPIPMTDFKVRVAKPLSFESFFTWQPRNLVDQVIGDRRRALLQEVGWCEHPPPPRDYRRSGSSPSLQ